MSHKFRLPSRFQKISQALADIFFPFACFGCGAKKTWLCSQCEAKIPLLKVQLCFQCQKTTTQYGEACVHCESQSPLDAVFVASCYQIPVLKRMIHTYKYQFVESLGEPLGKLLAKSVEKSNLPLPDILVPVPLHTKRLRFRGFNQSTLLAEVLRKNFSELNEIKNSQIIVRKKHTKPQQETRSKNERENNLKNAFAFASPTDLNNLRNQVAWLIDDVATTRSTLTECACLLKKTGVDKVYAVVLAKD